MSLEEEIYNTQIDGDDGDDDDAETASGETGGSEHCKTGVVHIEPADISDLEFCLVSTDAILNLLIELHGPVCKRTGCNRQLEFSSSFVGTCLVVHWSCNAGHFGGRWAA